MALEESRQVLKGPRGSREPLYFSWRLQGVRQGFKAEKGLSAMIFHCGPCWEEKGIEALWIET